MPGICRTPLDPQTMTVHGGWRATLVAGERAMRTNTRRCIIGRRRLAHEEPSPRPTVPVAACSDPPKTPALPLERQRRCCLETTQPLPLLSRPALRPGAGRRRSQKTAEEPAICQSALRKQYGGARRAGACPALDARARRGRRRSGSPGRAARSDAVAPSSRSACDRPHGARMESPGDGTCSLTRPPSTRGEVVLWRVCLRAAGLWACVRPIAA